LARFRLRDLRRYVIETNTPNKSHHGMPSDRHTAYPPCTGTNDRNSCSHRRLISHHHPLGTNNNNQIHKRKIPNTAYTGRSIMRIHGSS
jgi:hypothetical protein